VISGILYWHQREAASSLPHESGSGSIMDNASGQVSVAGVNTLSSFQCFDTVGWVTRGHLTHKRTCAEYSQSSLLEQMKEGNQGGELANPGSSRKRPLKWLRSLLVQFTNSRNSQLVHITSNIVTILLVMHKNNMNCRMSHKDKNR